MVHDISLKLAAIPRYTNKEFSEIQNAYKEEHKGGTMLISKNTVVISIIFDIVDCHLSYNNCTTESCREKSHHDVHKKLENWQMSFLSAYSLSIARGFMGLVEILIL
jgi:hypothetical protein